MALRLDAFSITRMMAVTVAGLAIMGCARAPDPPPAATLPPQVETPVQQATATSLPNPTPTEIPSTPTPTPLSPLQSNVLNLIQSFVDAPYRVVAVAKSPLAPYTLIVATERAAADCDSPDQPQRCTNDELCGSIYTSPTCYFFVEPAFHVDADPVTRYISRWPDEPTVAALVLDSFHFIDPRTVEFQAAGGDGNYSVQEVWWLDIVTGALAMQSRVEQSGGDPLP